MVNTRHGHAIYPLYTAIAQNTCSIFQKLNCNHHSPANGQYTPLTCHISAIHCNSTKHLLNISKIELQPSFTRKWSIHTIDMPEIELGPSFTCKQSIHAIDMPYIRCTLQ